MSQGRTLQDIHRDVEFANKYRIENIKHLLAFSAGIFVLLIAFMRYIIGVESAPTFKIGLIMGWGFLVLSMIGDIFHMKAWDRFYISYRKPKRGW